MERLTLNVLDTNNLKRVVVDLLATSEAFYRLALDLANQTDNDAGQVEPDDLTEFFRVGEYGNLTSVNDYEAFSEEYDLEELAEFWNEGGGWTFADIAGLLE